MSREQSEAPRKIWISKSVPEYTACDPNDPGMPLFDYDIEYTRTDLARLPEELRDKLKQTIVELRYRGHADVADTIKRVLQHDDAMGGGE